MPDTPSAPAEANDSVRCVPVPLGERSYEVLIGPGLIAEAGRLIVERLGCVRCGVCIVALLAKVLTLASSRRLASIRT